MEYVPIQSYYKSTLAELYNNEGEAFWDVEKLVREIEGNQSLKKELYDIGYKKRAKSLTAEQVKAVFRHLSQPILNAANRKLLKIERKTFNLLKQFEDKPELLNNSDMEKLAKISNGVLSELGLRFMGGDFNDHYSFIENDDYYFIRSKQGFELHKKSTLSKVAEITDTPALISTLIKLKNGGI